MVAPNNPVKYRGTDVYLANIVTRNREPTGADFRQPETGRLYPIFCGWQVGKNPVNGVEGELWLLTKIVANVAYWQKVAGVNPFTETITGDDTVIVTADVHGNINLLGDTVANGTNSKPVFTASLAPHTENIEVQLATTVAPTPGSNVNVGLACFNSNQFQINTTSGMVSLKGSTVNPAVLSTTGDDAVAVVPSAAGNLNLFGNTVANATHAKPLFVVNSAVNTERFDIQIATTVAPTPGNTNSCGIACFNNTQFTVDATSGMVSVTNAGTLETLTGDTGGAVSPNGSGNINLIGGGAATGVVTTGVPLTNEVDFNVYRWVAPASNNWTPVVAGSTSAGTATYIKQHGVYSRVGNMIFFTFDLQWTGHTGTGNMMVTGFPKIFALANTNYPYALFTENIVLPAGAVSPFFVGANSQTFGTCYVTIDNSTKSPIAMDAAGTICAYGFYFSDAA